MEYHPGFQSIENFERAQSVIPSGVSSPVRAFRAVGGTPLYMARGKGAFVTDVDGETFLDFVGSWGPLILGHAHDEVVQRVQDRVAKGLTFGTPCESELLLAERIVKMYPGIEQVRFVSSGTEATMSALRLARGATGRDLIVKFSGCYHGHSDQLLVAAGSGLVTFGKPSSAGVPEAHTASTLVVPLDDEAALRRVFDEHGAKIAAVIIEPVPANNGLLVQRAEYMKLLREITREHGALLIFDEVITGFRLAPGGAAQVLGIEPDIAAFGKVIGGGMPVGAFGAKRDVMAHLAPEGAVYQAGTLSGNPVAMEAGLATLDVLQREQAWDKLEALGQHAETALTAAFAKAALPCHIQRAGSLFWMCLQDGALPRTAEGISSACAAPYAKIFHGLLHKHIYIAPSAYEVGFLSLAHSTEHVDQLAGALADVVAAL